ncbi:MAG: (2Fe-2S)-binding protein [Aquificae bacterium]|nr:(2Fe-2S)-binding protein [Aquificota bacterium]
MKVRINGKLFDIPKGVKFSELSHQIEKAGIEFGCTDGQCGVCVARVVQGMECLNEPSEQEEETLWRIGAVDEDQRLTCQLVIEREDCEEIVIESED